MFQIVIIQEQFRQQGGGGITGVNRLDGIIKNCYNIGQVTSTNFDVYGAIGGYIKLSESIIENNYYLENCFNHHNENNENKEKNGIIKLTKEQFEKNENLLGSAYKKDEMNQNDGYPILVWQ